mgnify:CR=1 FL=1
MREEKNTNGIRKTVIICASVAAGIALSCLCIYLVIHAAMKSVAALPGNFLASVDNSVTEIRQEVKEAGSDIAGEIYHVKNVAEIKLGDLESCSDLEVLKVRESALSIVNAENELTGVTSWIEVIETCEYVVDLTKAEFIVDNEAASVTVKAPMPEPGNFTVEKYNEQFSYSSIFSGSAKDGNELIDSQIREADETIRRNVSGNQDYLDSAKNAAETMITNAITALNAGIEELQVNVEFV